MTVSYAARWVLEGAAVASLGMPSSSDRAGIASRSSPDTETARTLTGLRSTNWAQRTPAGSPSPRSRDDRPRRALALLPVIRVPANPSIAGSSVRAMTTATITANAAPRPISVSMPMPMTLSPARAMTTVNPANTTADPAVPRARPAASSGVRPSASSPR